MPSFLGRGATTPLADPLLNIRSPIQTGDSCGLAYCISDQLGGDAPDFHLPRPGLVNENSARETDSENPTCQDTPPLQLC